MSGGSVAGGGITGSLAGSAGVRNERAEAPRLVRAVQQAAREPVRLALVGPDGPTGTFSDDDGPLPW